MFAMVGWGGAVESHIEPICVTSVDGHTDGLLFAQLRKKTSLQQVYQHVCGQLLLLSTPVFADSSAAEETSSTTA
jgi:hypothetical protein